jgi:hypothetical protein
MKSFDSRKESVYTRKIGGGKRRSYFIDIKTTRKNDYYIVLTENSKKEDGYERHKIFIYKEDINKFLHGLTEASAKIKELMPDYDFDMFNKENDNQEYSDKEEDVSW